MGWFLKVPEGGGNTKKGAHSHVLPTPREGWKIKPLPTTHYLPSYLPFYQQQSNVHRCIVMMYSVYSRVYSTIHLYTPPTNGKWDDCKPFFFLSRRFLERQPIFSEKIIVILNMDDEDEKAKLRNEKRLANLAKAREKAAMLREQLKAARETKKPTKQIDVDINDDDSKPEATPEPTPEAASEEPTEAPASEPDTAPPADPKPVPDPDPTPNEQSDHPPQKPKRKAPTRAPRAKPADRPEPRRDPTEAPPEIVAPPPRVPLYRRENGLLFI